MDKHWSKYQNRYGYYEGEMKNGQRNGVGRFVYSEGGECFGTWENDVLIDGKGVLWFNIKYGLVFKGKYIGDIKNDMANGQGHYYCNNNNELRNFEYSGGFKNGVFHGQGTQKYYDDGSYYSGKWENGLRVGYGIEEYKRYNMITKGYFNDKADGEYDLRVYENGVFKRRETNKTDVNTQSEGCYIATCVYGDYDCPQVMILRKYRDEKLKNNLLGRTFIKCYYAISPKLVKIFKNNNMMKNIWKKCLDRIINKLKKDERN